ncbi:hypothetical protein UNDKW_3288 [Undibacterium sp. KW1]|uniref:hypothetical protein n=1 Tax=Undibacterium sp. KW1 TaxID=2058624 RepID=UPI001331D5E5|nr:hypothetical protein [Undibacterium sp. KW1]BBB61561.1 hypothetical protein UNDKW_3288 [Undibacterium sp. KW1]
MKIISVLKDERVDCFSVMTEMAVADYLNFVSHAYSNRGGIEGQRDQLTASTAIRIRKRMSEDFLQGAVLPPVVIGLIVQSKILKKFGTSTRPQMRDLLKDIKEDDISIIDGMQRTTAIQDLNLEKPAELKTRTIRVEFWMSAQTNSLIYRMLVLNSGQVPWNLRRQIEVVFSGVLSEIKKNVKGLEVKELKNKGRRTKGGQFQSDSLIELFLVFGARKEKVDTKERLADEFTRLDFIEASSDDGFTKLFFDALSLLVNIDKEFDRLDEISQTSTTNDIVDGRFSIGKDIFSSQPACVGFMTAIAIYVLGRPGSKQKSHSQQVKAILDINTWGTSFVTRLKSLSLEDMRAFLDLETLNSFLSSRKSGKIGEFEREFFLKAFQVLIEDQFKTQNMAECWRAF